MSPTYYTILKIICLSQDVNKAYACPVGGKVNWYVCGGEQYGGFSKS